MPEDNPKNTPPAGAGESQDGGEDDGQNDKLIPQSKVEDMIKDRLKNTKSELAQTKAELAALRAEIRKGNKAPDQSQKSDLQTLAERIKGLEDENRQTKADADRAKMDLYKEKAAKKAGLPAWVEPALISGSTKEEVDASIEAIQDARAQEDETTEKSKSKKKSFGNKSPKGPNPKQQTASQFMNALIMRGGSGHISVRD